MHPNPELELALNFVSKTDRNLFLTGKAGTGKTTFLHRIKNELFKRMIVVAPTGVAAINAKGVTIHSFFQLPFGPILPNQLENETNKQRKFSKKKIDIIKSLDLLIIDEVSMVRADLLDGIDQILRKYKNPSQVFGGVQLLLIGDVQQLAPVVKPDEWSLLQQFYATPYFFSSKSYHQANFVSVELKYIYRQKNADFITILNEIRNDELSATSAQKLNERYNPNFNPKDEENYITLTTHNRKADAINQQKLASILEKSNFFKAKISGDFNENAYPNDADLELKIGAQVMFIKNDASQEKNYFNGKIGIIQAIEKDVVSVRCDDDQLIEVTYDVWENVTYSINDENNEIKEKVIGSFAQIPLRLAWAITIHKSQGLTFDKAIIDAEASFAHGQTYVALSRCTSLEGLVLKTKITSNAIITDEKVVAFNHQVDENKPTDTDLQQAEKQYQLNLIKEIFDFHQFIHPLNRLSNLCNQNAKVIKGELIQHLETIKNSGVLPLLKVANQFENQLKILAQHVDLPTNDAHIQQRFKKGINYFLDVCIKEIVQPFSKINYQTDNKQVKKDIENLLEKLQELISEKVFIFKETKDDFHVATYLQIRAKAALGDAHQIKKQAKKPNEPLLALQLRELRNSIAEVFQIPVYQVFTQETLYNICDALPKTLQQLKKVKGMGKVRVEKYGEEILEVVAAYCKENELEQKEEKPKEPKKNTKQITLELFKQGLDIQEIASARSLSKGTIESHLASFIPTGDVDVLELIPLKKYQKMLQQIEAVAFKNLTELKEKVDDEFTYMELRMVLLSMEK